MKALKWVGIVIGVLVALVIIAFIARHIYDPVTHQSWVKPGISQKEIPAGVNKSVVFVNVTVIPMDSERILEVQTVIIEDHRIAYIGTGGDVEIPAGAYIVDGEGRFLIPGLSDMHVHTYGSENILLVYLANGVTTIRTMGEDPPAILEWRDQIRDGTRAGPNMWVFWPSIENNDRYPYPEWEVEMATRGGQTFVHTPEEAEQLVAEMAALGVDGIKAHGVVSSEIYLALLESAARHGLPIDGHAPEDHTSYSVFETRSDSWNDFRTMGVPALAHVEELVKMVELSDENTSLHFRQASDESIRQMAQDAADDGLWVTTTVFLFRSIVDQASDLEGTLSRMPEVKYVHPEVFDAKGWGAGANYYVEVGSRPGYSNYLAAQEKMLLALSESGPLLMSGTDAPVPLMVPGFSLHDELETMVDIGLSPYDVLRTSTYNPALYLGELEEFGTIEEGKRADLVLLEANPLEDITNTRQIAGVMVRGRYYSRADLDLMLEEVAKDYEAAETTQTVIEIAFPIVVVLLLISSGWIVVRSIRQGKTR
jgi:imidazolonepropionase-like amidohydrolase